MNVLAQTTTSTTQVAATSGSQSLVVARAWIGLETARVTSGGSGTSLVGQVPSTTNTDDHLRRESAMGRLLRRPRGVIKTTCTPEAETMVRTEHMEEVRTSWRVDDYNEKA